MKRFATYLLMFFPTMVISTLARALVLQYLWGWFINPLYTELQISFVQAFGLILVFSLILRNVRVEAVTPPSDSNGQEIAALLSVLSEDLQAKVKNIIAVQAAHITSNKLMEAIQSAIALPFIVFVVGWIVHRYLM